ncbi:alpha-galactosidase [Candidatus Epulonipiscium fishelsonii]|uniref:Alpha-galactosidase n=1 Tax=Candidatus Epulonipiscium fishelsonii TaxID=77094 RepID=A0ACC8XAG2_9FIRM|nr:alpha-galactosidase [Epulopiscium sp. SCG-D08WGA-EpuloA1]
MILFNNNTFHITNGKISYIFKILRNEQLGQLYFGKAVKQRDNFDHLLIEKATNLAPAVFQGDLDFSLEVLKQEYPSYGTGDFRDPAIQITQANGSSITDFVYKSHVIKKGKPSIKGLPSTYGDNIETLEITLYDALIDVEIILKYSIFETGLIRSAEINNFGENSIKIDRAMSASLDLYDDNFEMITLNGAWGRERHIQTRKIVKGVQSISSARGASSAMHNPFLALKREDTTEQTGEVYGFSLIYSGNFLAQVQVDVYDVSRVLIGINPFEFEWKLEKGESFHTPEAVLIYSDEGLNGMSQNFHNLFKNNLMRSSYREKARPILINNWEATYFDFNEDSILEIAKTAKKVGVELFVLDDGWFGNRNDDTTSLGDWSVNLSKLPNGIKGLAEKVNQLGLQFGLWFEPEMVNEISDLYKEHPDYVVSTPNRRKSYGRNQYVLDFSRNDVVNCIFEKMCEILDNASISYIKWDMNRNITEAYSYSLSNLQQKEFFHRYILGVYSLYEKLIDRFPNILFESCSAGGARFDPGLLYYAPQAWTSDDTDAVERLHIQYGTSMLYPIASMGSHVAAVPNHQVDRCTSLKMRADVAYFGTFGYELDLNNLSETEIEQVEKQIMFFKEYREVIQLGDFYRLQSGNFYSWMVVSKDKKVAILGYYKILASPNPSLKKIKLVGLDETLEYELTTPSGQSFSTTHFGDELMNCGLILETEFTGLIQAENFPGKYTPGTDKGDFTSQLYIFNAR